MMTSTVAFSPARISNPVVTSAEFVASRSRSVNIRLPEMSAFCENLEIENDAPWLFYAPVDIYDLDDTNRLHFILLLNAISFRFWGKRKWRVEFRQRQYDGAWGLVAALWKALKAGDLSLEPTAWRSLTESQFARILHGTPVIPRLFDRLSIIREIGEKLCQSFDGSFDKYLLANQGSPLDIVQSLANDFESLRDVSQYLGQPVFFYKRAQLMVADMVRMCPDYFPCGQLGISDLSACADYKLPWLLRRKGILSYAPHLARAVDTGQLVPHNSAEEVEIRANTIWAIEEMKFILSARIPDITSMTINDHLWLESQARTERDGLYHQTDTIFY